MEEIIEKLDILAINQAKILDTMATKGDIAFLAGKLDHTNSTVDDIWEYLKGEESE